MARRPAAQRARIFERDEGRCSYCGERFDPEELTLDHVQPVARGGDHSDGNLVTACTACNTRKGHRRLSRFLADEPAAREIFFRLARRHVWARHLRAVEEELSKARRAPLFRARGTA
jgi:5-methylcytosine-specific restriction endonuclease McrA